MSALAHLEPEPLGLRAALYLRISRDGSGRSAGVERQEAVCRDLVSSLGWEVGHVLTDNDVSAFTGRRRPAYERLLALIESGEIDAVVAYHTDRLYRRLVDLIHLTDVLKAHPVEVRTVMAGHIDLSTASGRFNAHILGAAAEHESARTGERIMLSQSQSRRKGRAHGGRRPYGYERTAQGELTLVPEEATIVREMAERLLAGDSQFQIALDLNRRGVPTSRPGANGRPGQWTRATIRGILRSPRVAGLVPFEGDAVQQEDGKPVKASWEPILDPVTWQKVRALLEAAKRGRPASRNLLAGFLRCGRCGGPLIGHDRGERAARIYKCRTERADRCQTGMGVTISAHLIEPYVVGYVIRSAHGAELAKARARRSVDGEAWLANEIATDEAMLLELAEDYAERRITRAQRMIAEQKVQARLAENRGRLVKIGQDPLPDDLVHLDEAVWADLGFEQQRALVELFVDHVVVLPARPEAPRAFDPGRVSIVPRMRP
jgi:DNA invertase Pin-like site-specific DNA recombinase